MAGFAYTNSTNFRPFSYNEMLAPLLAYTEAHHKVEEEYGKLNTDANAIGALADETDDPKTYAKYKAYENSLREQADALAQNGLTPSSRKSLLDLKGRYASEITPIQDAITRRRKLGDTQMEARLKDPTLMFQRDLTTISPESSLDRFLENSEYNYGDVYSGAMITKQVSDMASHLANQLRGTSSGRLDDYTKTFMQNYGLSVDEVLAAINNPESPKASKALSAIYDTALASVPQSIRDKYADDVRSYANQGFWSAIGQDRISTYEDYAARMGLKNSINGNNSPTGDLPLNPTPIISSKEAAKKTAAQTQFGKYFTKDKDGKYKLTEEGVREYFRKETPNTSRVNQKIGDPYVPMFYVDENGEVKNTFNNLIDTDTRSNLRKFIDDQLNPNNITYGGGKALISEEKRDGKTVYVSNSEAVGDLYGKYIDKFGAKDSNKATQRMEYSTSIPASDQADFKDAVLWAAREEGKLYGVDMDNKEGMFVRTNDDISLEDLVSDDYAVISRADSSFGRTLFVKNKKTGEVKRYEAPAGIHYTAENSSDNIMYNMNLIEEKLQDPSVSSTTRKQLEQLYDYYKNQLGMINSQIGITTSTPQNKPNAYSW